MRKYPYSSFFAAALLLTACGGSAPAQRTAPSATDAPPDAGAIETALAPEPSPGPVRTYVHVQVPMFSPLFDSTPLADVEGEVVTLRDLTNALAGSQSSHSDVAKKNEGGDYTAVLERLIDTRLMLVEALAMELDEDPQVQQALADFETGTLRAMVRREVLKGVEADPAEIERIYQDLTKRWKVRSALFDVEADAKAFRTAVAGGSFDEVLDQWVADEKAKGGAPAEELDAAAMLPQVFEAVAALEPGNYSPPVRVPTGFAVIHLEEITHPDDDGARNEAQRGALELAQGKALRAHYDTLVAKYVQIDERAVRRLNLAVSDKKFAALSESKRVLATIEGEAPLTVGDLADAVGKKYFHGIAPAVRDKKINGEKFPMLERLLAERLFAKQAEVDRLRETDLFRNRSRDNRIATIVSVFIQRVVAPEIEVTEGQIKEYYEAHLADYSYPAFVRLRSLGFSSEAAARDALQAAQSETDWDWLVDNADGQTTDDRSLPEDGKTLAVSGLDPELAAALSDLAAGAVRLYQRGGVYYIVQVVDYAPSKPQPYEQVREPISKIVLNDNLNEALTTWVAKLRKGYKIRRYMLSIETTRGESAALTNDAAAQPTDPTP